MEIYASKRASEAHKALKSYYEIWRMEKLIDGMKNKLHLLEELIQNSSDAIQLKYQNVIQYILFFITLLSVVGLAASLHDYLATGYDPRLPEGLSSLALSAGKGAVVMISGCFVAILLLVFCTVQQAQIETILTLSLNGSEQIL